MSDVILSHLATDVAEDMVRLEHVDRFLLESEASLEIGNSG